jgi:hypothetical protein
MGGSAESYTWELIQQYIKPYKGLRLQIIHASKSFLKIKNGSISYDFR